MWIAFCIFRFENSSDQPKGGNKNKGGWKIKKETQTGYLKLFFHFKEISVIVATGYMLILYFKIIIS